MSEDRKEVVKEEDMDTGMTILMVVFAVIAAAVIIYSNYVLSAIEDFGAPPFIIAFCISVATVIGLGAIYAIVGGGKGAKED